jgi:hypothetical protein
MKAYRVKDWDDKYEVSQSRKCARMHWVAIPNSHNTNGYAAVVEHPRAVELFAAFILIVEVASTMPVRGLLVSKGGLPLTSKNLSFITKYPEKIFKLALEELIKPEIGWLEATDGW